MTVVGVDERGYVDLAALARSITPATCLVSVMLANNETGCVQNLRAVVDIVRAQEPAVVVHTDAAQAVGKIEVDVAALGVDLLSIAGHKLYAPKGVGALYVRRGIELRAIQFGANHENDRFASFLFDVYFEDLKSRSYI